MSTVKELEIATGGLSNTTKMPGLSFGIPAKDCAMGSVLRKINNSVCSKCYAHKGTYSFPVVKTAQQKRIDILSNDLNQWADDMMQLIERKLEKLTPDQWYFRWHDAGDIQSVEHLIAIADIAVSLPWIQFWLPTKEKKIVNQFLADYDCPENLVIRLSMPMIGMESNSDTLTSTVGVSTGFQCKAYTRKGECGDCRECWNPETQSINYKKH